MNDLDLDDDLDGSDLDDDGSIAELPGGISVEVNNMQSQLSVDPEAVARLVRVTLDAEGVTRAAISVALVDDPTIRVLNRRHLGHDWPTDVISFLLSDPDDLVLSAELVVSVEMAVATAVEADAPPWDELSLYLVHGSLHLCGHDDQDAVGREVMRRREGEILAHCGLRNTFSLAFPHETEAGERERARWTL